MSSAGIRGFVMLLGMLGASSRLSVMSNRTRLDMPEEF